MKAKGMVIFFSTMKEKQGELDNFLARLDLWFLRQKVHRQVLLFLRKMEKANKRAAASTLRF